jgi:glycosyltransferase involved in cell wall biosynthesis
LKIVVVVQDYPSLARPTTTAFVHSRNLWYSAQGVEVVVASFACKTPYTFDGIHVAPANRRVLWGADVIVSHAPNVRNHVRLLWSRTEAPVVFFFHGFEVLKTNRYYPRPFSFQQRRSDPWRRLAVGAYDAVKVRVLRRFLQRKRGDRARFVFVSDWMRRAFSACVPGGESIIDGRNSVIPNAVHPTFERQRYRPPREPLADFVTFRPHTDVPKYAIDLVIDIARRFPNFRFDVYGTGRLPEVLQAPTNLRHIDRMIPQSELAELASSYRAALIPSRLDAQGVTACEMATFGIPTIVSDLPVAREFLEHFPNVGFIDDGFGGFAEVAETLWARPVPPRRPDFLPDNTCAAELALFESLLSSSSDGSGAFRQAPREPPPEPDNRD